MGRPHLILVQCVYSRIVLGYHLTMIPPNVATVVSALQHACMPKPDLRERFGGYIRQPFEVHGLPTRLVMDNDGIFHSDDFEAFCELVGIRRDGFMPSYEPQFKGRIERMFRTLNDTLFHRLRGAARHGPGEQHDGDRLDNRKSARINLETLEALIHKLIVDIHPYRFQKRLNAAPIDIWRQRFPPGTRPPSPARPEVFAAFAEGRFDATLTRQGIAFMGGYYGVASELDKFKKVLLAHDRTVHCRYNPRDLGCIWAQLPTGTFVKLSARNASLKGVSEVEVRAFLTARNERDRASMRALEDDRADHVEMMERASNARKGSLPFAPKRRKNALPSAATFSDQGLAPGTAATLDEMTDRAFDELDALEARIRSSSPWK